MRRFVALTFRRTSFPTMYFSAGVRVATWFNKLKQVTGFVLIIAAGVGVGYVLKIAPVLLKPAYVQGDYSAYFPDRATRVVVYGTSWCQYCAKARAFLKANHIRYVDLDIEKSEQARAQHARLGGGGVPLLLIGDRKISGFNQSALSAAIGKLNG